MLDLLQTLYDFDPFRFALWETLTLLHLDHLTAWTLDLAGFHVWEDYSVSPK